MEEVITNKTKENSQQCVGGGWKIQIRHLEEGGGEDADGQPDHRARHPGRGQQLVLVQVGREEAERPGNEAKFQDGMIPNKIAFCTCFWVKAPGK